MKNKWDFDEFTQVGTDYSDIKKVEDYDNKMSKFRNYKQEAGLILDTLKVNSNHILLEIGTGTGHFAIEAAAKCKKVYAIDVSTAMLNYARSKAEKENIKNIEWFNYGFLTFDFPGMEFDCVVSSATLHHLPDFWKMTALHNVYKSLKKYGKFLLTDIIFSAGLNEINFKVEDWINNAKKIDDEYYSESIMHIKNEYSTYSWIIEGMLERVGFKYQLIYENNNFMAYLCIK
jgi:ubiquinone/menaquinone biosynthesis C-methylase UbiE